MLHVNIIASQALVDENKILIRAIEDKQIKESWLLDKNLSYIEFELPVLFANNVQGKFEEINRIIEIDLANKENNKAIFSVKINSINMNYKKYKNLLLSDIFFDSYPLNK